MFNVIERKIKRIDEKNRIQLTKLSEEILKLCEHDDVDIIVKKGKIIIKKKVSK